jgi:dUTP pyrophosphatase
MKVRIKKLHADAILPSYAHGPDEDAAMDLCALERAVLMPGLAQAVPTVIAIELPPGHEAQVRPRSGLALKHSITVNFGTIDPGYRGEIRVIMFNLGPADYVIEKGDWHAPILHRLPG